MTATTNRTRLFTVLCAAFLAACTTPTPPSDAASSDAADVASGPANQLDLLFVIDNSNASAQLQYSFLSALPGFVSAARGSAIDVHVGVVSTDLGTAGHATPGCAAPETGDDGLLNPIRNGWALMHHEPWVLYPGNRPADCTNALEFPTFLTFTSSDGAAVIDHDVACNTGIGGYGCGLEQPLEAIWRALVWHRASDPEASTNAPNGGFLRRDAVLGIVLLTEEEDGSTRNCMFANGAPCTDASDVFDPASTQWASMELNMRFYMYTPGTAQDPTWPLERYIDPRDASAGLLALKPGHPERIVFGAITGVPVDLPRTSNGDTDWDALLGAPDSTNPDDFDRRDNATAYEATTPEGAVSMRSANIDPDCPQRPVPSCRRPGSMPGCTADTQYFGWPARRIVEVARRFDRARLCSGEACGNGVVMSACASDYGPAMNAIAARIARRLQ